MTREEQMQIIADHVWFILQESTAGNENYTIHYEVATMELIFSLRPYQQQDLHIIEGEEYFIIRKKANGNPLVLYAVNVSGDSLLTAASELMDLISRKF